MTETEMQALKKAYEEKDVFEIMKSISTITYPLPDLAGILKGGEENDTR